MKIFAGQLPQKKPSREIARSRLRPLKIVFPGSQFKMTFDYAEVNFQTGDNQSGFCPNPVSFRLKTGIYIHHSGVSSPRVITLPCS